MSFEASRILTPAAIALHDSGNTNWSQAELMKWLTEAQQTLLAHRPEAFGTTLCRPLVAGAAQTLPDNLAALFEIPYNSRTCYLYPGCEPDDQSGCRPGIPPEIPELYPNVPWGDPKLDDLFPLIEDDTTWTLYCPYNAGSAGIYTATNGLRSAATGARLYITAGSVGTTTVWKFYSKSLYKLLSFSMWLGGAFKYYSCGAYRTNDLGWINDYQLGGQQFIKGRWADFWNNTLLTNPIGSRTLDGQLATTSINVMTGGCSVPATAASRCNFTFYDAQGTVNSFATARAAGHRYLWDLDTGDFYMENFAYDGDKVWNYYEFPTDLYPDD